MCSHIHFQHCCLYSFPTKTLSPVSFWNHPKIVSFQLSKFSVLKVSDFFFKLLYLQWVSLYIHLLKLYFLVILWSIFIAASLYLSIKSNFQTFRVYFISDVPFVPSFLPLLWIQCPLWHSDDLKNVLSWIFWVTQSIWRICILWSFPPKCWFLF